MGAQVGPAVMGSCEQADKHKFLQYVNDVIKDTELGHYGCTCGLLWVHVSGG